MNMEADLARFFSISDEADRQALLHVRTLDELWVLLQKKDYIIEPLVPSPVENHYLIDAWNQPYILEVNGNNKKTVIRILSLGQGKPQYVEITYDGIDVRERFSWRHKD